jgi:hypothetical protein
VAVATGCHVNPAPKDIDGLSRWLWLNHATADDASLLDAMRHLDAVAGELKDPREEGISRLQTGDAKTAGASFEGDLTKAAGLLLVRTIKCPLARVNELLVQKDQKSLHANYITYDRTFQTPIDDYLSGKSATADWKSIYEIKLLSPTFKPTVPGGTRFVKEESSGDAPHGPAIFAFAYFDGPAILEGGGSDYFRQSYQIQVFYERTPGTVVHLYAMWVEMKVGFLDSDGPEVASITLDSLKTSDDDYEKHCAK